MGRRLLASCFGLGWLPLAPGTWGSVPPVVVFILMQHFKVAASSVVVTMLSLALVGCIVCVSCAPSSITATGKKDPREVVADEFAAQAVTLVFAATAIGTLRYPLWVIAGGSFVLFRLLDIVKPWPIRRFEKLPEGWGVLADDLLAGIYAGIILLACLRLWSWLSAGRF